MLQVQEYFKQTFILNLRCLDPDIGAGNIANFVGWSLTRIKIHFSLLWWAIVAVGSLIYLLFNNNVISLFEITFLPFLSMGEDYGALRDFIFRHT